MDNVILFPSHKVGIKYGDKIAAVTHVENGRAVTLKVSGIQEEIFVFAHSDFMVELKEGDWVRFDLTKYGAIIIERLAQPGETPLPRVDYTNGKVYLNLDDPAWRLYEQAKHNEQKEYNEVNIFSLAPV